MRSAKQLMIVALLAGASSVMAAAEYKKPDTVEAFYDKSHNATVEDIDHESRSLAVKEDKGNTMIMQVHPEVRSFDEVKQGDHGKIEYLESVVVALTPAAGESGAGVPEPTGESVIVRNPGVKPKGTSVETYTVTATIDKIDYKPEYRIYLAELMGPNGNLYSVSIPKEVPGIRKINNGDLVTVELTPMLALDIDPE